MDNTRQRNIRDPDPVSGSDRDHWYRSVDWDEVSRTEFEARLARARPHNRIQYRRIKALAMLEAGDAMRQAAGRLMLEENLATPGLPEFERTLALATLARHERSTGRLVSAVRRLRDALAVGGPDSSGTNGEEEIELAEMLLDQGDYDGAVEAKRLLDRRASDQPLFVRSRYRLAVGQARACLRLSDNSAAKTWASRALDLATRENSGLQHHADLGLVAAPEEELGWLREVAASPSG